MFFFFQNYSLNYQNVHLPTKIYNHLSHYTTPSPRLLKDQEPIQMAMRMRTPNLLLPLKHHLRRCLRRQTRKAPPIRRHRMRNRLRILNKRVHIQIRYIVPRAMIILIIRNARLPTKQRHLLLSLDILCARKQPTSRDTRVQERTIVASAIERLGHILQARIVGEVILEQFLCLCGAGGTGEIEAGAVTVVDAVVVVGGGDHVEVEVEADLGLFGVREGGDVEGGAQETKFLGRDPDEADGVVDAVFGELDGYLEYADTTGAIVVDAGALVRGNIS